MNNEFLDIFIDEKDTVVREVRLHIKTGGLVIHSYYIGPRGGRSIAINTFFSSIEWDTINLEVAKARQLLSGGR